MAGSAVACARRKCSLMSTTQLLSACPVAWAGGTDRSSIWAYKSGTSCADLVMRPCFDVVYLGALVLQEQWHAWPLHCI